ncbi:MAG: 3'-5' exonuclease [Actinomycetota bacterium]|nr:3'-5' exonuclease [Actinomycetota bacterium]
MADPIFAVVDVETSGLSTRRHRILQIGVVTVAADGTVVDRWCSLVKLRWRFARLGPTRIHGLRRRQLRHAPTIEDAMDDVSRLVAGRILVGHNLAFDSEFLERAARRSCSSLDVSGRLCTMWLSRWLDPERAETHRLTDLCARYGVALDRPHDALADALATAQVLPHLLDAHGVDLASSGDPVSSLAPLFMPAATARRRSRHLRRLIPQL